MGTSSAGQTVESRDLNEAIALLMRWWGIFEAPAHVDRAPFLERLFTSDVEINIAGTKASGRDQVTAGILAMPQVGRRSHDLIDVDLSPLDQNIVAMTARFFYQIEEEDGSLRSAEGSYDIELFREADGRLFIKKVSGDVGTPIERPSFVESYIVNRAKAAIFEFQSFVDSLDPDHPVLPDIILDGAEFHNLGDVASSAEDPGAPPSVPVKGLEELKARCAEAAKLLRHNEHRALEDFSLEALGADRYQVAAQFDWHGETMTGNLLETHHPRHWILKDTGERFMKVETLLP
eukprot:s1_g892.t1